MNKTLRKAIMKRSELQTKYMKYKTNEYLRALKKQRNFCSKLYKKERKKFYSNLDMNNITNNKTFWKTVKPFLTNKGSSVSKITLIQNDKILSKSVSDCFSDFFEGAVESLGININESLLEDVTGLNNPVDIAIKKI